MNGCSKTEYREENLDDQIGIFLLESEFGERRVRRAGEAGGRAQQRTQLIPHGKLA